MSPLLLNLTSGAAAIVLEPRAGRAPAWRHWGAFADPAGLPSLADMRGPASFSLDEDVPLDTAPLNGLGWFGPAALRLRDGAGRGIAVAWTDCDWARTSDGAMIRLEDAARGVRLVQTIMGDGRGGFRLAATLTNTGPAPVTLDWLASAVLPLPADATRLVSWRGRHNAELVEQVEPMPAQAWVREGRRGIAGHGGPPGLFVLGEGAGHATGAVHGLQLCWSGDSVIRVERDDEGFFVALAGARLAPGEVVLHPGESWSAPEALAVYSDEGRNGATAVFHAAVRAMVRWPGGAMAPRKVHLNSWEACYFDHDEARILALAQAAAQIGIERFVLDDGWFVGRGDDTAGLGDWTPDPAKYPQGLAPLANQITAMGMEFGLWVEPEMVNPDSALYRAHPDWALALPERARPTARNQLVLDLSLGAVRDYLFGCLDRLLREVPIGYLKWDHNRDLAPAGGAAQVRGLYDLLARLRAAHPKVEIEACAGGGGRSDAGMAPFVHRYWTSDNIDAVSRVAIQRGFLAFLPPEMMGSHVGASPAHATGRAQALAFRAAVALPGHFGVEMDPRTLAPAERDDLAGWIAFHREWRDLLHGGQVWLGEGNDGLVWQAQGAPNRQLLFVIRRAPAQDRRPQPLRLPHLAGQGVLNVRLLRLAGGTGGHAAPTTALHRAMHDAPVAMTGSWLAHAGLPLPPMNAQTVAIFAIEAT
ncbi:alpha-galactosidase [Novosphingobium sp. SG919]|uniref:alpha-galactosidase n=1 Tax=unclassified Novosphingobium TaxID=2644732 RepID=UPI00181DCED3|nr:alpha-galactosidase [Novosphingobium sp. SG919]NMN85743.1 alpha-galactosidase [Novosphingobium sp. SG916]